MPKKTRAAVLLATIALAVSACSNSGEPPPPSTGDDQTPAGSEEQVDSGEGEESVDSGEGEESVDDGEGEESVLSLLEAQVTPTDFAVYSGYRSENLSEGWELVSEVRFTAETESYKGNAIFHQNGGKAAGGCELDIITDGVPTRREGMGEIDHMQSFLPQGETYGADQLVVDDVSVLVDGVEEPKAVMTFTGDPNNYNPGAHAYFVSPDADRETRLLYSCDGGEELDASEWDLGPLEAALQAIDFTREDGETAQ